MWRSSFLVNLQACRLTAGNFTNRWTPSQLFFNSILSHFMLSPCIDSSLPPSNFEEPPMPSTPVGNPGQKGGGGGVHTMLPTNQPCQAFLINRNATIKLSSINAIHVKQQHNVAFFIFKFTLKYMLGDEYM